MSPGDIVFIPFSILWCGFAIFWESSVITTGAPFFFKLWGIPFVLVGLYMVIGRFFADAKAREKTWYAVTNERVLISGGLFSRSLRSLSLKTLGEISLSEKGDHTGTIIFGASAAEVLVKVLYELSAQDPNFLTRFASRKHGRRRRYVAQNREDLYPERPDLMELSKQLSAGWWVGTNYSKSNIHDILKLACEVAGLNYGQNFVVNLGNGSPV